MQNPRITPDRAPLWLTIMISQSSDQNPTGTIIHNTWGITPVLTRMGTGEYLIEMPGGDLTDDFSSIVWKSITLQSGNSVKATINNWNATSKVFQTYLGVSLSDGLLFQTRLELARYYY